MVQLKQMLLNSDLLIDINRNAVEEQVYPSVYLLPLAI